LGKRRLKKTPRGGKENRWVSKRGGPGDKRAFMNWSKKIGDPGSQIKKFVKEKKIMASKTREKKS